MCRATLLALTTVILLGFGLILVSTQHAASRPASKLAAHLKTPSDNVNSHERVDTIKLSSGPVAVDDSYSVVPIYGQLVVSAPGVLANDTDADGDQLQAELVSGASHGTVLLSPDGHFLYMWADGFRGTDTFTYRASDGTQASNTATVSILVIPNRAPWAFDDSYTILQGESLSVPPPGVLLNDSDPDFDHLLAHIYRHPAHGTVNFSLTGGFSYTPQANFSGTDSFTYRADDGSSLRSNEATVTIKVMAFPPPTLQFSSLTYAVTEGCVPATLTVSLTNVMSGPADNVVTVDYAVTGGTASQKSDYAYAAGSLLGSAPTTGTKPLAGRLIFTAAEPTQSIQILINEDGYAEENETVQISLSNPQGAVLGSPSSTTLTINDNESSDSTVNPIDQPQNFVCQQYHDFLHRQPDDAGLAFWTSQIEQCGADQNCVDGMRHNVAMAFFLSIEFQQSGYFVERLYDACLGRLPSYEEFIREVHKVRHGVEVGAPNWEALLENRKREYAERFVERTDFRNRYPYGISAQEYVDKMFEYAAVKPTANERQAALYAYGTGDTTGRAAAMRKAMESGSVFRKYYNQGFVLVEYFGFLRRDPNDAPDSDWAGYDFWLNKMNAHSLPAEDVTTEADAFARVKRGEMVRAFILSREYRERFGKP